MAHSVKQQPLETAVEVGGVNRVRLSIKESQQVLLQHLHRPDGDLSLAESVPEPAVDPLETVLSTEGWVHVPVVLYVSGHSSPLFLLSLQQSQQSLLLLPRALHEVCPGLSVVAVSAGLCEDGGQGRVTAHLQLIFTALVLLQQVGQETRVLLAALALLAFGPGDQVRVADGLVDVELFLFGRHPFGRRTGQGHALSLLDQDILLFFMVICQHDHLLTGQRTRGFFRRI